MMVFPLLLLVLLLPSVHAAIKCVEIVPDTSLGYPVEIGKEFTATCLLHQKDLKADNIVWKYATAAKQNIELPKKYYKKINDSAGSITFNVTEDMRQFLTCTVEHHQTIFQSTCVSYTYGILLDKGYPPEKPTDVICQGVQDGSRMSETVTCTWNPGTRNPIMQTHYKLYLEDSGELYNNSVTNSSGKLTLNVFPHHVDVKIWVEAENRLGKVSSEPLTQEGDNMIKTDPPANVRITSEEKFPNSLLIHWDQSIDKHYVLLKFNIRFCERGSHVWSEVPQENTKDYQNSFRLQTLKPYTEYVVQVRCKNHKDLGYWSSWSPNATARTAEDRPSSKPDIWMNTTVSGDQRDVQLLLKKPVVSNGRILEYKIKVVEDNEIRTFMLPFDNGKLFQAINFSVQRRLVAFVEVTANNSAGKSPTADLAFPLMAQELPPVDILAVYSQDDLLWAEWSAPDMEGLPIEYVLEWVSLLDGQRDWQKEPRHATKAYIKGKLQPFVPYNVSVVPIYHRGYRERPSKLLHLTLPGKPQTFTAYLKEGVPTVVEPASVTRTWKNSAELVWEEIPLMERRGFISNYTIIYETKGVVAEETVAPYVHSFILKNLTKDTKYKVYIVASTVAGSKSSNHFYMTTPMYDPWEFEMIVVSVSIGFLFLIILIMRICFKNRETLKKKIWPQVPDPYNSTVAKWSPNLSARAGTPRETTLGDLSMVEVDVDVFDQKSLCDEDKTSLPALKKDKYLSEEHSSGIGGSSCMSSPRQSVSDSDEADSGQTTASTVQYSSVVGYKGQTPAGVASSSSTTAASSSSSSSSSSSANATPAAAHTFARSESTQPLLDSEEQQEGSSQGQGGHHAGRGGSLFRRRHGFGDSDGGSGPSRLRLHPSEQDEQDSSSLEFCPAEDASPDHPQPADHPADAHLARPPYMPQQSGYRPQ